MITQLPTLVGAAEDVALHAVVHVECAQVRLAHQHLLDVLVLGIVRVMLGLRLGSKCAIPCFHLVNL